jgi:hypothetical protein
MLNPAHEAWHIGVNRLCHEAALLRINLERYRAQGV